LRDNLKNANHNYTLTASWSPTLQLALGFLNYDKL